MAANLSTPSYKQIQIRLKQFVAEEELHRAETCLGATILLTWSRVDYSLGRHSHTVFIVEGSCPLVI